MAGEPRLPFGFAHRGAPPAGRRENSLPAFRRALGLGVDGLESDVWVTRDGVPVLHHDGTFRVPGRRRRARVWETDRADLPRWLPGLDDLYRTCGTDFQLSLDLKGPVALADAGARAALESARRAGGGATGRLWLCGTVRQLKTWRQWDGEVRLANSANGADIPDERRVTTHALAVADAGGQALNLRAAFWTWRMVEAVHGAGLLAFGWDAQRRATLDRLLLSEGVDAVYSDHVHRLMRAVLHARETRNSTTAGRGVMTPRNQ